MTIITTAQIELLRAAAAADDGAIDMPAGAKGARPLIKQGLAISLPQAEGPGRLTITGAGRAAVAATENPPDPGPETKRGPRASKARTTPSPTVQSAAPGGKLGELVKLLRHPAGATIGAMVEATGWQAHSVREAMSGSLKKKLGFEIASVKTRSGRVYRIVEGVAA